MGTANTKAIIIGSPSNPTGTTYDTHSLRQIGELAVKNQFYLISDEIYEALLYDGVKHQSLASFGEEVKALTFVVNGVSKAYEKKKKIKKETQIQKKTKTIKRRKKNKKGK